MKQDRLWLIDIYRLLALVPIITLHMYEVLFSSNQTLASHTGLLNSLFEVFVRSLAFSGYIIVFIFFFLQGFQSRPLSLKKLLTILAGLFTLSSLIGLTWYDHFLIEWDIYHFLFLSFALLYFLGKHLKGSLLELAGLFILSITPYEYIFPISSESLQVIFYGSCSLNESMWPIFPYIFFALFAFSLGKFSKRAPTLSLYNTYFLLLSGLLAIAYTSFAYFFHIAPGPQFGCYTHKLPSFYWIIFLTGLSLTFLASSSSSLRASPKCRLISIISSLKWNTHFGLCYILQWFVLATISLSESLILDAPTYFYVFPIIVFLCVEFIMQGVSKLWPS
ncbi:MAG: hypothetical protein ACRBBP_06430 [Bdellovibrionales bacterium]